MKNSILNLGKTLNKAEQKLVNGGGLRRADDCGGCIAYADSRDDGSDRTLRKWQRDLDGCIASSSDCLQ